MAAATISMREIMAQQTFTVKVHGRKEFKIRIWIGLKIIYLATKIMGVGIKVETIKPSYEEYECLLPEIPKEQIPAGHRQDIDSKPSSFYDGLTGAKQA